MRVLLVEDEFLIREIVVETLRDEGFEVIQATNGDEAMECCRNGGADVLVTDIRLPGPVDGWDVAECCRTHHPALHVIYATGFSPVAHRPVAGSLTLEKPFHPREIVRAIRQMTQPPEDRTT